MQNQIPVGDSNKLSFHKLILEERILFREFVNLTFKFLSNFNLKHLNSTNNPKLVSEVI